MPCRRGGAHILTLDLIGAAGLPRRVMVDASHGNSGKDHRRQAIVASAVADQIADGQRGLTGVMLESFLRDGRQEPGDPARLVYGRSVTDACMDFDATAAVLDMLAAAVRCRRSGRAAAVTALGGKPGMAGCGANPAGAQGGTASHRSLRSRAER